MSFAIDNGIEKKQLETSQREAILASSKNILVNAGAGSGKTFTILAKILHILDQMLSEFKRARQKINSETFATLGSIKMFGGTAGLCENSEIKSYN